MTTPDLPALVRAWIMAARWGLINALVALKLAEEDQQKASKQRLRGDLLGLDEFHNSSAHEEYRG